VYADDFKNRRHRFVGKPVRLDQRIGSLRSRFGGRFSSSFMSVSSGPSFAGWERCAFSRMDCQLQQPMD